MASVRDIVATLDRIDWNFPQSGSPRGSLHTLHPFPGNFIPQIPSFLIQVLSRPGDLVLDAFAGSGTAAVEALNLGRRAIAADRVTACVRLTAAKLTISSSPIPRSLLSKLETLLTWDHVCETDAFGRNGEGSDPRLRDWYAPRTLAQLRYVWELVERSPEAARPLLLLLFSDVLFACASTARSTTATGKVRKHHWGWVADNVTPKDLIEHNAVETFRNRLSVLARLQSEEPSQSPPSIVIQDDARRMALANASIDLIVTSPPYVGVIDYTCANRLTYLWMGWPFDGDRGHEIGARHKRRRRRFVEEYVSDISACWKEFHRVLRDQGYCALVIGESRRFQGTVNRVLDQLGQLMPLVWGPVARQPQRRRVTDRTAGQPVEYICVFHKT